MRNSPEQDRESDCKTNPELTGHSSEGTPREGAYLLLNHQYGCNMTLEELVKETLVQKHRRLRQEKCPHPDVYRSTVAGPTGIFTNSFCLDCGKSWHSELTSGMGT